MNGILNRANLIDKPIVKHLIEKNNNGGKFLSTNNELKYSFSGNVFSINTVRNKGKHIDSSTFLLHFDRNNLQAFNHAIFCFLDEIANLMYMINGYVLLKYIVENMDDVSISKSGSAYILIARSDLYSMAKDMVHGVIELDTLSKNVLAISRDDTIFRGTHEHFV